MRNQRPWFPVRTDPPRSAAALGIFGTYDEYARPRDERIRRLDALWDEHAPTLLHWQDGRDLLFDDTSPRRPLPGRSAAPLEMAYQHDGNT